MVQRERERDRQKKGAVCLSAPQHPHNTAGHLALGGGGGGGGRGGGLSGQSVYIPLPGI